MHQQCGVSVAPIDKIRVKENTVGLCASRNFIEFSFELRTQMRKNTRTRERENKRTRRSRAGRVQDRHDSQMSTEASRISSPSVQSSSFADERTDRQKDRDTINGNHSRLNSAKNADSAKRFAFLLGQTDLFRHFIDLKGEPNVL